MENNKSLPAVLLVFPMSVIIFGILLVCIGAFAEMKITFLGQSLETVSVGIGVIFFASAVYYFTYKKYLDSVSELKHVSNFAVTIPGSRINFVTNVAMSKTDFWYYAGHTGKYVRTMVVPHLNSASKESGHTKNISLILMSPSGEGLSDIFREYKNATNGRTPEDNKYIASLFGTILSLYIWKRANPLLNIEISLIQSFGVFRVDICTEFALITTQSKRDPAILMKSDSPFYKLWSSNFEIQKKLSKTLDLNTNLEINFDDIRNKTNIENIKLLFERNGLTIEDNSFLDMIIIDAQSNKNPYA